MHLVITLVHGTFNPGATWTQPGSFFRNELTRRLGDAISFEVFSWSGSNNHAARFRASEALREQLLDTIARHPSSRHFVIAHSHGGNVARYALRERRLREHMGGLVCLATPFISCERRTDIADPFDSFWSLLVGVPFLLVALILLAASQVADGSLFDEVLLVSSTLAVAVLLFSHLIGTMRVLGIVLFPLMAIAHAIGNRIDRTAARLVEQLAVPPASVPTLCVRVSGDEASWALERFDRISERPFVWLPYVAIGCLGAAVGGAVVAEASGYAMRIFGLPWLGGIAIAGLVAIAAGFAGLVLWALLMLVVAMIRLPVLGWETPFATWSCRIWVHPMESGSQVYEKKCSLSEPVRRWRAASRLEHCAVYNDADVVVDVASWLRMRSGLRPLPSDPSVNWYRV